MEKEKSNQKYVLDGYRFASRLDYEQAKKEAESVAYVRSGLNINDEEALYQTYQKLTEHAQYRTPIGLGFLRELQRHLARKEENRKRLSLIPVAAAMEEKEESTAAERRRKKFAVVEEKTVRQEMEELYRGRLRNLRIVVGFLLSLVIILFVITWRDQNVDIQEEREKILNEYAGWKEELELWERDLREREEQLEDTE